MRIDPDISAVSVVLLGSFNPPIFNPGWLERKSVVGVEEASEASIEVIHREMAVFRVGQISIRVLPDRFTAETLVPPLVALRDFVVNVFNLLPETPILKMGINLSIHFPVADFAERDKVGIALAPHDSWGEWAKDIPGSASYDDPQFNKKHGGLRSISMMQRDLDDRDAGHVVAKVEPSLKLPCGIFVEVNDQYEVSAEKSEGAVALIRILEQRWDDSVSRSEWIVDQVMSYAE